MQLRFNKETSKHTLMCEKIFFLSVVFKKGDEKNAFVNLAWESEEGKPSLVKKKKQLKLNSFIDMYAPKTAGKLILRKDSPQGWITFPDIIGELKISFQNSPDSTVNPEFDVIIEFIIA
ncbi:MAG: hypothetical protein HY951_03300 [Bacteroidia bacterium]|nr:hypothetical protein [Bacteroidia bacterium]